MFLRGILYLTISFFTFSGVAQINSDHFAKKALPRHLRAPDNKSTEIGLLGGISQYNGELNPSLQFKPAFLNPSLGLVVRRNLSSRWAVRFNGLWGKLNGDDQLGNSTIQERRGFAFKSTFLELTGQAEFNFIPFCAADNNQYITPYVFAGLGAGKYFTTTNYTGGTDGDLGGDASAGPAISMTLPFGLGIKYKFSHRFLASVEWGMRKAFTDYIDGVSTVYASTGIQFGNSKNNDWYSVAGICLTIRIGPELTTCTFGQ